MKVDVFLPGPYSLNGYRVRVYRQDSATQWFTGIITHHDLFSRNMVVMNDQVPHPLAFRIKYESETHLTCRQYWIKMICVQVLEPQNVDPSMIQMTFLDDVVHSLLKGENIGITSRRRSRSSQNNNTAHVSKCRHTATHAEDLGHGFSVQTFLRVRLRRLQQKHFYS